MSTITPAAFSPARTTATAPASCASSATTPGPSP